MRIIAGKYRRRKLLTKTGLTTRPITDRAKEPLFERLTRRLEGARIADVFAGTGTLGLEALSRGAHSVVFVEQDSKAVELLKKNVDALSASEECLCWRADAMRCSFRPQGVPDFVPFDLIFFDPPYRMVSALQPSAPLYRSLERLARSTVSAPDAMLCLRTPTEAEFAMPPVWTPHRILSISSMDIHLYNAAPRLEDESSFDDAKHRGADDQEDARDVD